MVDGKSVSRCLQQELERFHFLVGEGYVDAPGATRVVFNTKPKIPSVRNLYVIFIVAITSHLAPFELPREVKKDSEPP